MNWLTASVSATGEFVPNPPVAATANDWEVGTWLGYTMLKPNGQRAFRTYWDGLTAAERATTRARVDREIEDHIEICGLRSKIKAGGGPVQSRDQ